MYWLDLTLYDRIWLADKTVRFIECPTCHSHVFDAAGHEVSGPSCQ